MIGYEEELDDDGCRHKGGLRYELSDDGKYWYYEPDRPFTVDGIRYSRGHAGVQAVRLMIDVIDETGFVGTTHICSRPPSADELDRWVRYGYFSVETRSWA